MAESGRFAKKLPPAIFFASLCLVHILSPSNLGQTQPAGKIADVEAKLEELYNELRWKDKGYYDLLDSERKKRINNSPKGEFETTKQFEARTAANTALEEVIEKEVRAQLSPRIDFLQRQIVSMMSQRFPIEIQLSLGTYNADRQTFSAVVSVTNEPLEFQVALADAPKFKTAVNNTKVAAICSIILDSNGKAKIYVREADFKAMGRLTVDPVAMTANRAMTILFGQRPSGGGTSWYRIVGSESEREYAEPDSNVELSVNSISEPSNVFVYIREKTLAVPIFSQKFTEGGKTKFILVAASLAYGEDGNPGEFGSTGCHWCGLPIGAIQFVQRGEFWDVEAWTRDIGSYGGSWGSKPVVKLVQLGIDASGIAIGGGGMGMGTEIHDWNFLSNVRGAFRDIFYYADEEDSTGRGVPADEYSIQVKRNTALVKNAESKYSDIKLTTVGRSGKKVGAKYVWERVAESELFRFTGDEYKPLSAATRSNREVESHKPWAPVSSRSGGNGAGIRTKDIPSEQSKSSNAETPVTPAKVSTENIDSGVMYSIMTDNSGSMREDLPRIIDFCKRLILLNQSDDQSSLMRFVGRDKIEIGQPFTSNKTDLIDAIDNLYIEGGQTAVIDAVYVALEYLDEAPNGKLKRLILVTDGDDGNSFYNSTQLYQLLRETKIPVLVVGLTYIVSPAKRDTAVSLLDGIARESGGRAFFARSPADLPEIAKQIGSLLREKKSVADSVSVPTPKTTPNSDSETVLGGVSKCNGATSLPKPAYPAAARAVRAAGSVTVRVLISESGSVISANAISGHPLLRAAAESAARGARFSPTLLSGLAVKVSCAITYDFIP